VCVAGETEFTISSYQLSVPLAVARALRTSERGSNAFPIRYPKICGDTLFEGVPNQFVVQFTACFVGLGDTAERCDGYERD
jgi:hypothetical protein